MRWIKASEPLKASHSDLMVVKFLGKNWIIENRYGEYWIWRSDNKNQLRVSNEQWGQLEYLDESTPASAEQEAARMYPAECEVTMRSNSEANAIEDKMWMEVIDRVPVQLLHSWKIDVIDELKTKYNISRK